MEGVVSWGRTRSTASVRNSQRDILGLGGAANSTHGMALHVRFCKAPPPALEREHDRHEGHNRQCRRPHSDADDGAVTDVEPT
jgi:hypothetical protein